MGSISIKDNGKEGRSLFMMRLHLLLSEKGTFFCILVARLSRVFPWDVVCAFGKKT
jgi:hypothetical protein